MFTDLLDHTYEIPSIYKLSKYRKKYIVKNPKMYVKIIIRMKSSLKSFGMKNKKIGLILKENILKEWI